MWCPFLTGIAFDTFKLLYQQTLGIAINMLAVPVLYSARGMVVSLLLYPTCLVGRRLAFLFLWRLNCVAAC
jgi:hypothetical protein